MNRKVNKNDDNGSSKYVKMIPIHGEHMYVDLKELEKYILIDRTEQSSQTTRKQLDSEGNAISTEITSTKNEVGTLYDTVKLDLIMNLLDNLTVELDNESPDIEGAFKIIPLSSRIAFNTLVGYGIIKKY